MFKKSFFLAIAVIAMVFTSALAGQLWITHDLPSSYDTGLTIGQAFKTSQVPLLIEFYSDTCGSCKRVSPWLHHLAETSFKGKLTPVMLNTDEPETMNIAKLFGVNTLPAIYVFDHKHMKKHPIAPEQYVSESKLKIALQNTLQQTRQQALVSR